MYGMILERWGDRLANIVMCISLFGGVVLTCFIKSNLKRQAAQNSNSTEPIKA